MRFVDPLGLSDIAPHGEMFGDEWRYHDFTRRVNVGKSGKYWYVYNFSAGFQAVGHCDENGTLSAHIQADSIYANSKHSEFSDHSDQTEFNATKETVSARVFNVNCVTQKVQDACGCHIDGEKSVCTAEAIITVIIDTEIRDLSGVFVVAANHYQQTIDRIRIGPLEVGVCCPKGSPARR